MATSRSGRSARRTRPARPRSRSPMGRRRRRASSSRWCPERALRPACPRVRVCAASRAATTSLSRTPPPSRSRLAPPRLLGCGPPSGAPVRRPEAVGDVDRLARDLPVAQLEDADAEVLRSLVVGDRELHDSDSAMSPDLTELETRLSRILAAPLAEVLDSLEPLAGLRELKHRILAIHRV